MIVYWCSVFFICYNFLPFILFHKIDFLKTYFMLQNHKQVGRPPFQMFKFSITALSNIWPGYFGRLRHFFSRSSFNLQYVCTYTPSPTQRDFDLMKCFFGTVVVRLNNFDLCIIVQQSRVYILNIYGRVCFKERVSQFYHSFPSVICKLLGK